MNRQMQSDGFVRMNEQTQKHKSFKVYTNFGYVYFIKEKSNLPLQVNRIECSSVARGGETEGTRAPHRPESLQNSGFLPLLRLIFALKTKIAPQRKFG